MSDSEIYSDESESEDLPSPIVGYDKMKDSNVAMYNTLNKVKYWKSKYHKCKKEKEKNNDATNNLDLKVKELSEMKMARDELKLNSEVEIRTLQLKITQEEEQNKKYQVLLKQSKGSVDEMVQKHQDIANLNKNNEAKLYHLKIENSTLANDKAKLEEQLNKTEAENCSLQKTVLEQQNKIRHLSHDNNVHQKDSVQYKERCSLLSQQLKDLQELCEKLDQRYIQLTQEHMQYKEKSEVNSVTLNQSMSERKDECLKLLSDKDSLSLNYKHCQETLKETQAKLSSLEVKYEEEKKIADRNLICLKQTEMSLTHLKDIYEEKESQMKEKVERQFQELEGLKKEFQLTKNELRDSQNTNKTLEMEFTQQQITLKEHIQLIEKEKAKLESTLEQSIQRNKGATELTRDKEQIERQLTGVLEENTVLQNKTLDMSTKIHNVTQHCTALQKDRSETDALCKRLKHQVKELQDTLRKTEDEHNSLSQQYTLLKKDTDGQLITLQQALQDTREKCLQLTSEKDSLAVKYAHSKEALEEAQEKLHTLEKRYEEEKKIADKNLISLKEAELNLSHLSDMYEEKEKQLKEKLQRQGQEWEGHKKELQSTNNELCKRQATSRTLELELTQQRNTLQEHIGVLQKAKDKLESNVEQIIQINKGLEDEKEEMIKKHDHKCDVMSNEYLQQIGKLESTLKTKETQLRKLQDSLDEEKNIFVKIKEEANCTKSGINQLNRELGILRRERSEKDKEIADVTAHNQLLLDKYNQLHQNMENDKIRWKGRESRYVQEIRDNQAEISSLQVSQEKYKTELEDLTEKHDDSIAHSITTIQHSLAHLTPHHTVHTQGVLYNTPTKGGYRHSPRQKSKGGESHTVSSTQNEHIATLNTELGHLQATSEHLHEKMRQLESDKVMLSERYEKLNEEHSSLITSKNNAELEMSKQREVFKEEIRNLKNDVKNADNKYEVLKKKLDGSREQLTKQEHDIRNLQNLLNDKTNSNDKLSQEIGGYKTDNNVLSHSLNESKEKCREYVSEIENLKTRITVISEDNKNIRIRNEEMLEKLKHKDILFKEVQDKITQSQQELHTQQVKAIEETQHLKEEYQEKIYTCENEIKQLKYEKEHKDEQIRLFRVELEKRNAVEMKQDSPSSVVDFAEYDTRYNDLWEKYSKIQQQLQGFQSDKIMAENQVSQLQYTLETEREKGLNTENVVKDTTNKLNDIKEKHSDTKSQINKLQNEITRLEELLKVEKDKYTRLSRDYDENSHIRSKLEIELVTKTSQISKLHEDLRNEQSDKQSLLKTTEEKERMLDSEAKLRLHLSSQLSCNNNMEGLVKEERKKVEKLEEKIETLEQYVDKLKIELENEISTRSRLNHELTEERSKHTNIPLYEDKIRQLKQKIKVESENTKKIQEDFQRKVKKVQAMVKEETAQRKELTEKYMSAKSQTGELQGKITVLLSENTLLKQQKEEFISQNNKLSETVAQLEVDIKTQFVPRAETEIMKKNVEAKTRVEMNRKLHDLHLKIENENKSRETINKFKTDTENKMREDMEKTNRQLKQRVEECYESMEKNEKYLENLSLENERLKQIIDEERRTNERMMSQPHQRPDDPPVPMLPLSLSPKGCHSQNIRCTQDANATWLLMKTKLNQSLNKYVNTELSPITPGGRLAHSRPATPDRGSPRLISPRGDAARTSADSFF